MKHTIHIVLLFLLTSALCAQNSIPLRISQYQLFAVENGLPSSTISNICLDDQGFILIKAVDIFQFDGSNFSKYKKSFLDSGQNFDFQKRDDGAILFYNDSDMLLTCKGLEGRDSIIYLQPIKDRIKIVKMQGNAIYYMNRFNKLIRLDLESQISRPLLADHKFNWSPTDKEISTGKKHSALIEINNNFIINIDKQGNLDSMQIQQNSLTAYPVNNSEGLILTDTDVSLYDFESKKVIFLSDYPSDISSVTNLSLLSINDKEILIAINNRIFLFDWTAARWVLEFVNEEKKAFVTHDFVNQMVMDKFENIYIHYNHTGLLRIQKTSPHIQNYRIEEGKDNFTKQILVNEDSGRVIQVTAKNGIRVYNIEGELQMEFEKFRPSENNMASSFATEIEKSKYFFLNEDGYNTGNYYTTILDLNLPSNNQTINSSIDLDRNGMYYSNPIYQDGSVLKHALHTSVLTFDKNENFSLSKQLTLDNGVSLGIQKIKNDYWQFSDNKILVFDSSGLAKMEINLPGMGIVRCLQELSDSIVLVGGDKGIASIHSRDNKVDFWEDISECIYAIAGEDEELWCSTNQGIIQIRNKEIIQRLVVGDGIQGNEFNTNCVATGKSGRIYFGGVDGSTAFHPDSLSMMIVSKKVIVPYVRIENKRISYLDQSAENKIVLEAGEQAISFQVNTIGPLSNANYRVQYFISNQTPGWIDAGKNGIVNHSFAPGNYKVYYTSSTYFDSNAPLINFFDVKVKALWYQSNYFYLALILLASGGIAYVLNLRNRSKLRLKLEQIETKEKIQEERDRISRELHDNIGVQLGIVGRSIDWLVENLEEYSQEEVKSNLEKLNNVSLEINQSLRDTIWASKKEMYSLNDVSQRITVFVHKLKNNISDKTFHYQYVKQDKFLSPSAALNMFRIVQEGVFNAIKYSDGDNIWVTISENGSEVNVEIKDDGLGFDIKQKPLGNGINNMHKRAAESNFKLTIDGKKGIGTRITFGLP